MHFEESSPDLGVLLVGLQFRSIDPLLAMAIAAAGEGISKLSLTRMVRLVLLVACRGLHSQGWVIP